MLTKVLSLVTGLVTLDVYLQSPHFLSDPLFAVISGNLLINFLMVALAGLAVAVSFRERFITWGGWAACAGLAVLLLMIGACGTLFSGFSGFFWAVFMPLNYLLMLEVGIILAVACLSYKHADRPQGARLPRPALPAWFAFPVPKISHSPGFGRSAVHGG